MRTLIHSKNNPLYLSPSTLFQDDFFQLFNHPSTKQSDFPKWDFEETEQYFLIHVDLPGVKKENLNIEIKDKTLTLSGERKSNVKREGYSERYFGTFEKHFSLPEQIETDQIEAHYEDGVLKIALPKSKSKASKKIEITDGQNPSGVFSNQLN